MIETERLLLRPLRVSDLDVFVELHADPQVNRFVGSFSRQQALPARLGFAPRREDHLQGRPVTVYALDRPAELRAC
ncbi:GNAT family N-acetyltransferase [Streptomyces canus]|uniref:GNAT family N-acetyltransferase n=1 Tax=Streptomyces canus TaxID=58343 RepID=UPI0038165A63